MGRRARPCPGKRSLRISFVTQASSRVPTLVFFVNDPALFHFSYQRYLENVIRDSFPAFRGTPFRIEVKKTQTSQRGVSQQTTPPKRRRGKPMQSRTPRRTLRQGK